MPRGSPTGAIAVAVYSIDKLISETRRLAAAYRLSTGKTLPVSGEIAVHDAIRLLGLEPAPGDAGGYDAVRGESGQRLQIKGRVVFDDSRGGHRVGQLDPGRDWDGVLLVLMDRDYQTVEIWEAQREALLESMHAGAGGRRHRRGALSVARFKHIGRLAWSRELGAADDGYWCNRPG